MNLNPALRREVPVRRPMHTRYNRGLRQVFIYRPTLDWFEIFCTAYLCAFSLAAGHAVGAWVVSL